MPARLVAVRRSAPRRAPDREAEQAPRGRTASSGRLPRRPDIQGLRAVAVLAVVGGHVVGWPPGGFVGVDVFFVISGYLITGMLWREIERTGRVGLLDFYRRRIKRTVPLALLVIAATLAAGALVLPVYRLQQLASASVSAAGFWINWQLIATGTDYLHAHDVPSALQHYWSLAVEEQFYLVWPLLLLVVAGLAGRLRWNARATLTGATLLGCAATLGWAALQTATHPQAAYFSPFTRAWELGAGALLALVAPRLHRLPGRVRTRVAWAGLTGLAISFVTIGADSAFPFPWAVLPVAATALVIAASEGASAGDLYPLTNRLSQYIGRISYPLYLWHFPVLVLTGALMPQSVGGPVLRSVVILALAALSHHLVEDPLRRRAWRLTRPRPPRPAVALRWAAVAVTAALAVVTLVASTPPRTVQAVPLIGLEAPASAAASSREVAVQHALEATRFPAAVRTAVEQGRVEFPTEWTRDGCLREQEDRTPFASFADRCVYGDRSAPHRVVVLGDSIAIAYVPAIRRALASRDWRIEVLTAVQCPVVAAPVRRDDGTLYPECASFRRQALARIRQERPDVVVLASSSTGAERLVTDSEAARMDLWRNRLESTVRSVATAAGSVLLVDAPPTGVPLRECLGVTTRPSDCRFGLSQEYVDVARAQHDAAERSGVASLVHVATASWFCDRDGVCPSFTAGAVTLADAEHLTAQASTALSPLVAAVWPRDRSASAPAGRSPAPRRG